MPEIILKSKQHIYQVDYIRAIAALAVVLFHLGGKGLPILKYGWLGVHMFFFLSGFIICWAIPRGYTLKMCGKFISKRIVRIEPPYIVSIVLSIGMHFLFNAHYHINWENALFHLAYLNSFFNQPYLNPVYWTLAIEFQFYLFIAFIFPIINKKGGVLFVLALCLVSVSINIPGSSLANFFPEFSAGIIYYLYISEILDFKKAIIVIAPVIICCFYRCGYQGTLAVLIALLLMLLPLKSTPLIRFFANISFSLYLTHDLAGSDLVVYLGTLLPKTILFKAFEFIIGIISSIAFAWLFYLLIERPFLHLSKHIVYTKKLVAQNA